MKNKILKIFLSLLIIAQSMIFQVSAPQLVLCVGDEGHVAVEVSENSHSDIDAHNFKALFAENRTKHHLINDDCFDIPLDYHFGSSHISNKKSIKLPGSLLRYYSQNESASFTYNNLTSTENRLLINQHISVTVLLI